MKILPLRRIARLKYGDALAAGDRTEGRFPVVGSGGISGSHDCCNFQGPGIVVGRKGSYGSIHWVAGDGFAIDTAYYIDRSCTAVDLRWLYYALHAVDLRGISQDAGVPGLSRDAAYEVLMPGPPTLEQQRRIADFLDAETARIDRLGAVRGAQFSLLAEHEMRALDDAFRSARSRVKMRLKNLFAVRPRYGVLVPDFVEDGVPFIRVNDLLDLDGRADSLRTIPATLSEQYARTVVRPGDLLMSVVGTLGRAAIAPPRLRGANIARAVCSMRFAPGIEVSLVKAWLGTSSFRDQARLATSTDTAQPTLGMEDLGNFSLEWPSDPVEREALLGSLTRLQDHMSTLRYQLERQKSVLAERRTALITAAVTGQFDVSTASGRGIED
jgi:type I restriction enzyme S subunit